MCLCSYGVLLCYRTPEERHQKITRRNASRRTQKKPTQKDRRTPVSAPPFESAIRHVLTSAQRILQLAVLCAVQTVAHHACRNTTAVVLADGRGLGRFPSLGDFLLSLTYLEVLGFSFCLRQMIPLFNSNDPLFSFFRVAPTSTGNFHLLYGKLSCHPIGPRPMNPPCPDMGFPRSL